MRVLIAGCGYVGSALARRLVAQGNEVVGLNRTGAGLPPGVEPAVADLTDPGTLTGLDGAFDAVVYSASPDARDEHAYRAAYLDGLGNLLRVVEAAGRLLFVSSTAVYAQADGSWVDEDSPTEPTSFTGRVLLEAEARARSAGGTVLRLGGIYGPTRSRLVEQVRAGEATCPPEPTWTNRIHRDDAAGALAHLLLLETCAPLYLGVDDEPAERGEVLRWLADRLGAPAPPVSAVPSARGGSKRVSNRRLRQSGYRLRYPSFRDGYAAMLG